ncbi:MAG: MFS transporter [Gammaproteobacteria bacterium]|nr:MFS transporter [Gammaproteobacteria bacterium]MCP5199918.1 MFS transporter [Gammaproteobacteria bacterium]
MAGFIGNVVEWYDFALYGYMASFLSTLFFPGDDRLTSLLATYGVFAAGFVMRPLGSAFFGWLGDTVGRSRTMLLSVALMAIPTFALGCLPTYDTAGPWAAALLVLVRLVQGLSVGGEFSSSVTYLVETADPERRGFAGSWANIGSIAGMLLGSGAAAAVTWAWPHEVVLAWAWRVPFLVGAVLGIIGVIYNRHLPHSDHFREHEQSRDETSPLVEAFTVSLGTTLRATAFASVYGMVFYFALVYLPTWASEQAGYDLDLAMRVNVVATAVLLVLIPLSAWVSDHLVRRTRLIGLAMAGIAVAGYPLFQAMASGGSLAALVVSQGIFALLLALPLGAAPAMFVEMFPERDRLSGYSVAYNLGLGVVGGATPMIATAIIKWSGSGAAAGLLLVGAAGVGLLAVTLIRDRSREPLR